MKKIVSLILALITLLFCLVGCSKFEYNTVILKDGFTFKKSWII